MDTETLSKIVPGISRLEKTGDNAYNSILEIKMGPVSGSFTGNLQMENIEEQKGFTLMVQQNSSIGNANATMKIELIPVTVHETEIAFDGDVKVSGLLASMGQRILGSAANMLTKQFFCKPGSGTGKASSYAVIDDRIEMPKCSITKVEEIVDAWRPSPSGEG